MVLIAYLVQTHAEAQQVDRLVQRLLLDPGAVIHVSHDRTGPALEPSTTAAPRVHVSYDVGGRGRFHNVQRWLDAVAWLRDQPPVDYVVTLTGQDYPVRSSSDFAAALEASGDGLVEHFPALGGGRWRAGEGRDRYTFAWYDLVPLSSRWTTRLHFLHAVNKIQPLLRVNVSYGALRLGVRRLRPALGRGARVWGGSFFTNLSWRAALHVLEVAETRADVLEWGRRSLLAEEAFIPTILLQAGEFSFVNSSGRYYDFTRSRHGRPADLTVDEVPAALRSGCFFARKWGSGHASAYRLIDAEVLGG